MGHVAHPQIRTRGNVGGSLAHADPSAELPAVTYADLAKPPFGRFRWGVRQSGTSVPTALADALENLWEARVTRKASR